MSDKNNDVIAESSFDSTPVANATAIEGGNIVAPHTQTPPTSTANVDDDVCRSPCRNRR